MKNILKISLLFVLGLVIGCVITAFTMNKFHRKYLAELYSMELVGKAMNARLLREGDAEIVSKTYENALPEYVLGIHGDNELRNAKTADLALAAAKRFYVCTKTEFPKEIAEIMNNLPPQTCEFENP